MFNKSFNLHTAVMNLRPVVRKQVLFALVGTLNAALVAAADKLAVRLEQDGYDFKELTDCDFELLMQGPDGTDGLHEVRVQCAVANEWREKLRHAELRYDPTVAEVEQAGSILATLNMMTGAQRARPSKPGAREALKAIGIEVTAEDIEAARRKAMDADQARADARANRKAAIITAIHTVFDTLDHEDTEWYSQLSVENKERLCTKFFSALNGAMTKATQNVLLGMTGDVLGIGDIIDIRDTSARLMLEAYPITPPKADEPKVRRVRKPKATDTVVIS